MQSSHKKIPFEGQVRFISCSPHGDPEGLALVDGSFIKIPPHSLQRKELFKIGMKVSGTGEVLAESPNQVFHHVQLKVGRTVLADDSSFVHEKQRQALKVAHKKELRHRTDAPSKHVKLSGRVFAVAAKPEGEIDRLILEDGTSVHVPKEVELDAADLEIGDIVEVHGEARTYDKLRFVRADEVRPMGV